MRAGTSTAAGAAVGELGCQPSSRTASRYRSVAASVSRSPSDLQPDTSQHWQRCRPDRQQLPLGRRAAANVSAINGKPQACWAESDSPPTGMRWQRESRRKPHEMVRRAPSTATSTGCGGRARLMSASSRPETSALPGEPAATSRSDLGGGLEVEPGISTALHRRPSATGPQAPGSSGRVDTLRAAQATASATRVTLDPETSCRLHLT